jgi:uncharacterized protein (DUF433 family)
MIAAGLKLVRSLDEVRDNIKRYQTEFSSSADLAKRASLVRAWYVEPDGDGGFLFAPSRFVGYRFSSAVEYLNGANNAGERDGRETEHLLSNWFAPVDRNTTLGKQLFESLTRLLERYDVRPNKLARINVTRDMVDGLARPQVARGAADLLDRIVSSPDICGGRPVIRGTRMRISDILDALASGATRETLIDDFDYLTSDDISAALVYASQRLDHRMIATT